MKRALRFLIVTALFLMLLGAGAQASVKVGTVTGLKVAGTGEKSITLKWNRVSGATGYFVYRVSGNRRTFVKATEKNTYTVQNLKLGATYSFRVRAVVKKKGKKYLGSFSDVCTAKTALLTPGTPKNFAVGVNGSKTLELTWDAAPNATGYEIYRYNKSKKAYVKIKTVKGTSCKQSGLKVGQTYSYVIRSVRTVGKYTKYSKYTKKKTGKPIKVSEAVRAVRSYRYYAIVKSTVKVKNITTGKKQTLKAGTRVTCSSKTGSANSKKTARLANGQKVQIYFRYLDIPQGIEFDASKDYSKKVKEAFVNSRNMRSKTNYLVWINHYHARVNIFKGSAGKWKLVRTFKVALGKNGSVKGYREICGKTEHGHYDGVTPIIYWSPKGNAFHTLLGAEPGTAVSSGCLRCETEDLMYLYEKVPIGTLVYSY